MRSVRARLDRVPAAISRLHVLSVRSMSARKVRIGVSVVVVAVSSLLIVAIFGTYGSVSHSVEKLTGDIAGSADIEVTGVSESGFDASLLPELAQVDGVEVAAPLVRTAFDLDGTRIVLLGVDPQIARIESSLATALREQTSGRGIDLTGVVAGPAVGVAEGDELKLGTVETRVSLVVAGEAGTDLNGGRFVIAPLGVAQRALDRPNRLDSALIAVRDGADVAKVRVALEKTTAGRAVVTTPLFRSLQASSSTKFARDSTLMVAAVALVVAAFIVFNTMNMAVAERRREIAILRAIGAPPGAVARDLIGEAALIGVVGGLAGIPLGIVAGSWAIDRLPPVLAQSFDAQVRYYLPWYVVPLAVALCVLACLTAASATAVSVLRIPPIEAIVPAGATELELASSRWRTVIGVIGCIALLASGLAIVVLDGNGRLAAAGVFLAGALLTSYALMGYVAAFTARVSDSLGPAGRLGAIAVRRAAGRSWITAMTVAVAVSIGITTSGSMNDLVRTSRALFAPLGDADLYVSATSPDVTPSGPALPLDLTDKLRNVPGVRSVVPMQYGFANLDGKRLLVNGVAEGSVAPMLTQVSADLRERVLSGAGVLVSRQLAKEFDLAAGDRFDLQSPSGPHPVTVLAIADYLTFDAGVVVVALDRVQEWFQRPGATYLELQLDRDADRQVVTAAVRNATPAAIQVYAGADVVASVEKTVVQMGALAVGVQWIVALVSAIALLNVFMLAVLQRRREIGVMRAMGASRRFVGQTVFVEAVASGVVGGVIGIGVGAVTQFIGTSVLSASTSVDVEYTLQSNTLLYGAVALVLCVAGVLPPAIRAAKMDVIDAVSSE